MLRKVAKKERWTHVLWYKVTSNVTTSLRDNSWQTDRGRRIYPQRFVEACQHVGQTIDRGQIDLVFAVKCGSHFMNDVV